VSPRDYRRRRTDCVAREEKFARAIFQAGLLNRELDCLASDCARHDGNAIHVRNNQIAGRDLYAREIDIDVDGLRGDAPQTVSRAAATTENRKAQSVDLFAISDIAIDDCPSGAASHGSRRKQFAPCGCGPL
jgi:hypothetical protein